MVSGYRARALLPVAKSSMLLGCKGEEVARLRSGRGIKDRIVVWDFLPMSAAVLEECSTY